MKRKSLILVMFLLLLYIGPMILAPSFISPYRQNEPNTVKDFSVAYAWYSESWLRRMNVSINGSSGAGTDYQVMVNVTYDGDMLANFDDIRFTDNDGITLLDYWMESYVASTFAVFWVKVSDDLGSNQLIYMYYGNSAVSTTSNGTATFLMFEDWSTESIRAAVWDITSSDGQATFDDVGASHGTIAQFAAWSMSDYIITSDYETTAPVAVMFRSNIEESSGVGNTARQGSGYYGAFSFALVDTDTTDEKFTVYDDDENGDSQQLDVMYFDEWITFQITRDGTNAKLYADTVLISTASCQPDVNTNPATSVSVEEAEDDLYSDWIAVRKFITTEPVFDTFGAEENLKVWNLNSEADLIFSVAYTVIQIFLGDAVLIILGLVMIPVSTIYLAYGAKHDRSSNRLFYGLIMLFLGFGLFIGGILP